MQSVKCGVAVLAMVLAACSSQRGVSGEAIPGQPPAFPAATLQELMVSEIDPAADFIWGSVGTVITAAGSEERKPRTDEQWRALRRQVITLIEATNLLVIPGRRVANEEFPSAGPGVFSSAEMERRFASDRASFNAFALSLREVALQELIAVDHRDVAALDTAGEAMDGACEACHLANWYPHQVIPPLPDFDPAA